MSAHPAQNSAVAVTGVGILTPLGDTLAAVCDALTAGRTSIAPEESPVPFVGSRFADFDATRYANVRGMRVYNRTTRLGICATRLALVDAGLIDSGFPGERLGVIMASTFGHLDTLIEYDRSLVANGPSRTNPALMPLAIPSAPGAAIALSFGAKACSITLADGGASSLDALGLGVRLVRDGRVSACVVVAAYGLIDELILSAKRAGQLAGAGEFLVFDERSRGTAFGEATVALVLERAGDARERGARSKAFVGGQASTFSSSHEGMIEALTSACRQALRLSATTPDELGLVLSGANGTQATDTIEARALLSLLGGVSRQPAVAAIKSSLGESEDASGLLSAASAIATLTGGLAPPIVGLGQPLVTGLRYLTQAEPVERGHALITATSRTGACSALVVSREAHVD